MSELANLPWHLIWPLIALQLVLMIVALVDIIRNQRTNGPMVMWLLIIIFINTLGPILYFIFGRKQG